MQAPAPGFTVPSGGSRTVSLIASPDPNAAFGSYTAPISFADGDSQASVQVKAYAVSSTLLNFTVQCEDEFTYFAEGNPGNVLIKVGKKRLF